MVSQYAIPSKQHLGGSLPYAFTEHGVLMLANVLRSGSAVQMSIRIIEVFIKMREMLMSQKDRPHMIIKLLCCLSILNAYSRRKTYRTNMIPENASAFQKTLDTYTQIYVSGDRPRIYYDDILKISQHNLA